MSNRAVGYIRVSTQGQAKEGESLNTQLKAIEQGKQVGHVLDKLIADWLDAGAGVRRRKSKGNRAHFKGYPKNVVQKKNKE